jgi:radical SAM protein with 4Fe4S-binding SPASM domain
MRLRQHGFLWGIVTNGYGYTPDIHNRLLSAGMGALTLSLDGLEQNHNWLRKNDKSFERAVAALSLIVSAGNRLNYDVVTCVNRRNIKELLELKEFLIAHNVKQWRLFTIAPIGRAANDNDMQLTGEDLRYLMDFIVEARKDKRMHTTFSCESYVGKYEKNVRDNCFFCRAGINVGSVLIDGSISACPNINRAFVQGNIYKDNFVDVWDNRFEIMRNRKWTRTGDCLHCKDYKYCEGGAMHLWDEERKNILACIHKNL